MSQLIQPLNDRARQFADQFQPVIVALGTAGLTGGTMAALGLIASRMWRDRRN